jgi:hypothetical protein
LKLQISRQSHDGTNGQSFSVGSLAKKGQTKPAPGQQMCRGWERANSGGTCILIIIVFLIIFYLKIIKILFFYISTLK